jgi:enoyl-[acyl-carrier protein] reductase II
VDAIVAEGYEAGGHNGKEETTTMVLIPMIRKATSLPLIAAGGIATGRGMLAAMVLGAEGVQIGTRFVASTESSAHPAFKQKILESKEGDTYLALKKLIPVRLLKNGFSDRIRRMEDLGSPPEALLEELGAGRAKTGMYNGDLEEGELEIGQDSAMIGEIKPAGEIIHEIMEEFDQAAMEVSGRADSFDRKPEK